MTKYIGVMLLCLVFMMPVIAQDDICDEDDNCWYLFDETDALTIERIEPFLNPFGIFKNPMLRASITFDSERVSIAPDTRLELRLRQPVELNNVPNSCDLLLVGFAESDPDNPERQYQLQNPIILTGTSERADGNFQIAVNIHAFCQRNNLPNNNSRSNIDARFPPTETVFSLEDGDNLNDYLQSSLIDAPRIAYLVEALQAGTCQPAPDAAPLAVNSISSQMAVFMIYEVRGGTMNANDIWQTFHTVEDSYIFRRDYAAVHCLLGLPSPELELELTCDPTCDDDSSAYFIPQSFALTTNIDTQDTLNSSVSVIYIPNETAPTITETPTVNATPAPPAEPIVLYQGDTHPDEALVFNEAGTYIIEVSAETTSYAHQNDGEILTRADDQQRQILTREITMVSPTQTEEDIPTLSEKPVAQVFGLTLSFGQSLFWGTLAIIAVVLSFTALERLFYALGNKTWFVILAVALIILILWWQGYRPNLLATPDPTPTAQEDSAS